MINQSAADAVGRYVVSLLRAELSAQGYVLSGNLLRSVEAVATTSARRTVIEFWSDDYGEKLNTGLTAQYFKNRSGAQRLSDIQELERWVKRRIGLSGRAALRVAFAIDRAHMREGMPTRGAYRFSSNGRRTGWVDFTIQDNEEKVKELIESFAFESVQILLTNFISQKIAA